MTPASTDDAARSDRRARKKARTRQELYRAAMRLFLARGYDAVTVDQICDAADVARATFFLHYPTKDALLAEYGEEARAEVATIVAAHPGSAAAALQAALDALVARATRHAAIVHLVVHETFSRPDAVARSSAQARSLGGLLADVIAGGQQRGELRPGIDPVIASATLTAAYFAIVGEWVRRAQTFDLATAIGQALDVVLHGLVRPRTAPRRKE